jgi:hypothetical protein
VALTIVLVLLPAWWLGYFIAFETLWRGRTLGKAALGLRVVTKEGAPVRFRHAAIRGLLGLVDFVVLGGFIAVVFILFSRDNQRLGDMVAGTLVLRERSALAPPAPVDFTPPPGLEHYTATLDPTGVGTDEYQAVRTFLIRATSLPPGPRSALALQLANPLAARLRPPPPTGISPEQYLACVAAAYQQRQRLAAGQVAGVGGLEPAGSAPSPPVGERSRPREGAPAAVHSPPAPSPSPQPSSTPTQAPGPEPASAPDLAPAPQAAPGGGFAPPG